MQNTIVTTQGQLNYQELSNLAETYRAKYLVCSGLSMLLGFAGAVCCFMFNTYNNKCIPVFLRESEFAQFNVGVIFGSISAGIAWRMLLWTQNVTPEHRKHRAVATAIAVVLSIIAGSVPLDTRLFDFCGYSAVATEFRQAGCSCVPLRAGPVLLLLSFPPLIVSAGFEIVLWLEAMHGASQPSTEASPEISDQTNEERKSAVLQVTVVPNNGVEYRTED